MIFGDIYCQNNVIGHLISKTFETLSTKKKTNVIKAKDYKYMAWNIYLCPRLQIIFF